MWVSCSKTHTSPATPKGPHKTIYTTTTMWGGWSGVSVATNAKKPDCRQNVGPHCTKVSAIIEAQCKDLDGCDVLKFTCRNRVRQCTMHQTGKHQKHRYHLIQKTLVLCNSKSPSLEFVTFSKKPQMFELFESFAIIKVSLEQ
jgi:hypothetical protein